MKKMIQVRNLSKVFTKVEKKKGLKKMKEQNLKKTRK